MGYKSFEDLELWKRSCCAGEKVYRLFKESREYAMRDQIVRSAVSVASNIAERAERNHPAEFKQFLGIAKGSAGELRTQLELSARMDIISRNDADPLIQEMKEISAMLRGLM